MKKNRIIVFISLIIMCFLVNADELDDMKNEQAKVKTKNALFNPIPDSTLIVPFHFFELSTSKIDAQKFSAQIGFSDYENSFMIGIETPILKNGDSKPITNSGLAKSTNVSFGFQKIFWKPEMDRILFTGIRLEFLKFIISFIQDNLNDKEIDILATEKVNKILKDTALCNAVGLENEQKNLIYKKFDNELYLKKIAAFKAGLSTEDELNNDLKNLIYLNIDNEAYLKKLADFKSGLCTEVELNNELKKLIRKNDEEYLKKVNNLKSRLLNILKEKLATINQELLLNKNPKNKKEGISTTLGTLITYRNLTAEYRQKVDEDCIKWNNFSFITGVQAKIGTISNEYLEDTKSMRSIEDIKEEQKYNFSLKGSAGMVLKDDSVLSISILYENYFKPGDSFEISIPFGEDELHCIKELSVGMLQKKQDVSLGIEYKKIFMKWLGINPRLVYQDHDFYLRLPVYFLQLKDKEKYKGLNGGTFFEWNVTENNFKAGVFIGATIND
jgi:hypothetical protein